MTSTTQRPLSKPAPPPTEFGGDPVTWAMWLYYAEGRTQNDVAKLLNVSRASIANYLAEARRRRLVSIDISPGVLEHVELARELTSRFRLVGAHVIPGVASDDAELRRRLGIAGAHVLGTRLHPDTVLGVAWGRTMLALAEALPKGHNPDTRVVQISGSSLGGQEDSPEFCTALIATRLGARCENFHAPAIVSSSHLRDELLAEPGIARQLANIRTCSIMLFGVGDLAPPVAFSDGDFMTDETISRYLASDAVGVVIGRFVDAAGNEVRGPLSGRQIGIDLGDVAAAPERICVAGGARKLAAIDAVLAGGYATHLVTDAQTARGLLAGGAADGTATGD